MIEKEAPPNKHVTREFSLSSLAVNNRTVIFILAIMILLGGLISYQLMPKENFPEVVIPTIYVGTTYSGNSPSDMENLITRPLEKEINTISGINKLNSTSIQDFSTIIVEFNIEVPVSKALQDVKDAVDKAKSELPNDLKEDPNIFELDFSEWPIMNINLFGDLEMDNLRDHAEYLKDEIEKLPEISEVEIKGAREREVRIDVDVFKMNSVEVSFNDIENAVSSENVTISGGDLLTDDYRRSVRVIGEFKDVREIEDIIVKHKDGNVVFLRDIANISFNYEDRVSFARSRDLPVISLDVKKRGGENLINAVDKISAILDRAKEKKFPDALHISITNDQSKVTRMQVSNLENSIISGVILVVLVLLFFLGLRNALFVGIAIPLSMLMGISILHFFDVTLNTMVLFSLILALGMLVDNGIVVVENVYRLMQEGKSPIRAAKEGVGEVALPIIVSTLTTLAAFFPLVFWNSLMGEFFKFLPITLIIVLSSSLFVALVINPVLTSVYMKVQDERKKVKKRPLIIIPSILAMLAFLFHCLNLPMWGNTMILIILVTFINVFILNPASFWFQHNLLHKIENVYYRLVRFALTGWRPVFFLVGMVLLFVASGIFLAFRAPVINFFPINEPQYVNVFIEMPLGTDIEKTNEIALNAQRKIYDVIEPYEHIVEAVITNVGEGTTDPIEGPSIGVTPHKAKITVSFVEYELREGINTRRIMEEIREAVQVFPGAKITVDKNRMGPPVGKQVEIQISGEDYTKLIQLTEDIKHKIEDYNIPGIEELKLDLEKGKPELIVHVDRTASRRYGISTAQIATAIRTALFGKEISKFKQGEDDYPIMLRFNEDVRYDLQTILNQKIIFRDQSSGKIISIPISTVSTIEYSSSYGSIKRKDLNRVITVFSNVKEGYNATEINNKLKKILSTHDMPPGFTLKFAGESEEQTKETNFLKSAFFVAVFLIFLIIVAQFNSLDSPIIIIFSVLFSTIGVFLGLAIFKMDVVIMMTGIGIISLAGIVVNNAIVLMDYINLIRERRRVELGLNGKRLPFPEIVHSIIEGGKTRLRPVLLTAITTILGLIPLAIGLNIDFASFLRSWNPKIFIGGDNVIFWGPMAWTVIFGLAFATFLTLVIVPVMYLSFDTIRYWLQNQYAKRSKEILDEEE